MKRLMISLSVAAIAASSLMPAGAWARPQSAEPQFANHNLSSPLQEKQAALKQAAFEMVLSGQATPSGKNKVVKVAPGQFVELAFEGEDQILTLLGEFGDGDPTHTADQHADMEVPAPGTHTGAEFEHNNIPQPNRAVDNTTIWTADFNTAHYDNLLYNKSANPSMANWYLEQSSGTYSVDGYVSDWVTVPNNPSAYGSDYCGDIVCRDTWLFVNDQADAWWSDLVAEKGLAGANAFLASFDVWDRYNSDGDTNFNEPDGYIDHFQSVHAGEGQEVGGGALGSDAIWSHRWYAWFPGTTSPDGSGPHGFGGLRIGDSDYWIGDYTIEPENGGVGVFAHEFAHDLGLPDLYATQGGENSTAWWTVMSQGSYGTVNGEDLGSAPTHFGAWEKFQLGFLHGNYNVASAGQSGTFHLGPAEFNNKKAQAMFVVLPNKVVTTNVGAPFAGTMFYYSGSADSLDTTMTRDFALPGSPVTLTAKVRYNIEIDFDFAYLTVDGDPVPTSLSNSSVLAEGIDGHTGGNWVDLTADLSAYAGGTHEIGFGYITDGGVEGQSASLPAGFAVDNLQINGGTPDGAETDTGWTYDSNQQGVGFHRSTGTESRSFFNAYVLENRQYMGYDNALKLGPYNFGNAAATPKLVEHFPYQDGLLISYWDNSFGNNNTPQHPGGGLILPVDSHPAMETWTNGSQMRPRIQSYDSTFTLAATDSITLHLAGVAKTIASKPGVSVFNDALRDGDGTSIYWAPGGQTGWNGVDVPNTGTKIQVKSISSTGLMVIDLNK